jgi:hypothetical protein
LIPPLKFLSAAIGLSADVFLTFDSDFGKVARIKCITPEVFLKKYASAKK